MKVSEGNSTELQIIRAARQVFIEKGFAETSMSDIAARAGINRPGLHYYFRTKEKMFEAVFADIVDSFIPVVQDIVMQDKPVAERIAAVVDVYFEVMRKDPCLPVFMLREIQRDASLLFATVCRLDTRHYINKVKAALQAEMDNGRMKRVPMEYVFYTFYGLLSFPFLTKPFAELVFTDSGTDPDARLCLWKGYIVRQMEQLLCI